MVAGGFTVKLYSAFIGHEELVNESGPATSRVICTAFISLKKEESGKIYSKVKKIPEKRCIS